MDYSRPELIERLAADYAAGTLRGAARRRLQALLPAHPALREAIARWEQRLMPMLASIPPEPPPTRVWKRIEARIGPASSRSGADLAWWQKLALWRTLAGAGFVATMALALVVAQPDPVLPPIVVVLEAQQPVAGVQPASFVASISGDGGAVVTRPIVPVALQADRALELWVVPPAGAPRSLGLISERNATVVKREQVVRGAAALAVSLEPAGGSPTGAPTGPILYVGKLSI
jgi:anti-sigma-K factor RskA